MTNEIPFILYNISEGDGKVQAVIEEDTIWLTQKVMAELFGVNIPAISKHLRNIFEEGDRQEKVVVSKMEITTEHVAIEGKTQTKGVNFYHLDAIVSDFDKEVRGVLENKFCYFCQINS